MQLIRGFTCIKNQQFMLIKSYHLRTCKIKRSSTSIDHAHINYVQKKKLYLKTFLIYPIL